MSATHWRLTARRMASEARRYHRLADDRAARHARVLDGLRDILGAPPGETLADAVGRVIRERDALAVRVAELEEGIRSLRDSYDLATGPAPPRRCPTSRETWCGDSSSARRRTTASPPTAAAAATTMPDALTPMTLADLSGGDITSAVPSSWDESCPECGAVVLAWEDEDGAVRDGDDAVCLDCGLAASWSVCGESEEVWPSEGHGRLTPEALAEARALRGEVPR